MKVLLIGAGYMSKYLQDSIKENNYTLIGRVDYFGEGEFSSFDEIKDEFDIIIDFSHHSMIKDVLEFAKKMKKNILIATTGHTKEEVEMIKEASKVIAILKATNTSIGVNTLNKIVEYASNLLSDFDIEIVEMHHNRKIDAPSGTANTLVEFIEKGLNKNLDKKYGRYNEKREKNEIGIHSIRAGNIVGKHSVIFSKGDEIIEISHSAFSRKIFSDGAINMLPKLLNLKNGLFDINLKQF